MKNRRFPYGYEMQNGLIVICLKEVDTVKQIFSQYLNGENLTNIAERLTENQIEFLPGEYNWNKSRIKRMIEDKRYIGGDNYPAIIDKDTFQRANVEKNNRIRNINPVSLLDIAKGLTADKIPTARGKTNWSSARVQSILTNEKYKGDALLQKTYIVDCISKKSKKNNGELPMYYVENNHPAIIERAVFDRVQEEISRRNSKKKVKQIGTKTELGKYSSKYALSEILYCGNCGTPYRRCTWSKNGKKKIVWRCISRLDYGKKYCKDSPSIEESVLHNAIAEAITKKAQMEKADVARIRRHIEIYQNSQDTSSILAKQERLKTIQEHINQLTDMDSEAAQSGDFDTQFEILYAEMYAIKDELDEFEKSKSKLKTADDSIEEMTAIMQGLKNHPVEYNDLVVRQLIECIKVISKDTLHIYFKDGIKIETKM